MNNPGSKSSTSPGSTRHAEALNGFSALKRQLNPERERCSAWLIKRDEARLKIPNLRWCRWLIMIKFAFPNIETCNLSIASSIASSGFSPHVTSGQLADASIPKLRSFVPRILEKGKSWFALWNLWGFSIKYMYNPRGNFLYKIEVPGYPYNPPFYPSIYFFLEIRSTFWCFWHVARSTQVPIL